MQRLNRTGVSAIWLSCIVGLLFALTPLQAAADDFEDYKTTSGYESAPIDLPTISGGYALAADYFPGTATAMIDGKYAAAGRLIYATGTTIYLQRNHGAGVWDAVGTVPNSMDPCFIHPSPDGSKIALGLGYGQDLLIVQTSDLSIDNPVDLSTAAGTVTFPSENIIYYDGDWADDQYFIIDGGSWPAGPGGCDPLTDPNCDNLCEDPYYDDPDCVFEGGLGAIDTETASPSTHTGVLMTTHDGASADVEVTTDGELLVGIGWLPDDGGVNRTGEIKIWADGEWDPTVIGSIDYATHTRIFADNLLSVAWMGQDAEGNLHVGGGDAFGTGGSAENGYAALVEESIVGDIAEDTISGPINDGNWTDISGAYKYFSPDPYGDDTATGVVADTWGRCLGVIWNPTGTGSQGSATDYWLPGVTPKMTLYAPGSAIDTDGDGIPNCMDIAYQTAPPAGSSSHTDTDEDGWANIVDADFDNNNNVNSNDLSLLSGAWNTSVTGSIFDMNSDGFVNSTDLSLFSAQWNSTTPLY